MEHIDLNGISTTHSSENPTKEEPEGIENIQMRRLSEKLSKAHKNSQTGEARMGLHESEPDPLGVYCSFLSV